MEIDFCRHEQCPKECYFGCTEQMAGHMVVQLVEVLCCKLDGSEFKFLMVSLEFFIDVILPAAFWPWD
jgi:hypothetical protein